MIITAVLSTLISNVRTQKQIYLFKVESDVVRNWFREDKLVE